MTKNCFKCKTEKDVNMFYRHSEMKDGYLNKCKECTKVDTKRNYRKNIEYYKAYDKSREQTAKRKKFKAAYQRNHRARYPEKNKARAILNYAIKHNKIQKTPCVVCGEIKVQGHHENYTNPLEVIWVCSKHHKEYHKDA